MEESSPNDAKNRKPVEMNIFVASYIALQNFFCNFDNHISMRSDEVMMENGCANILSDSQGAKERNWLWWGTDLKPFPWSMGSTVYKPDVRQISASYIKSMK